MPNSGIYQVKNIFGKVVCTVACNEAYVQRQYPAHAYTYTCLKEDKKSEYKEWQRK